MEAHEKYGAETVGIAADCSEKGAMEKLVQEVLLRIRFCIDARLSPPLGQLT
jgi:hypothetical protein